MRAPDIDEPCMVMVAPNGARKSEQDHPAIPLTARSLAHEVEACARAGAGAVHFHVRDAQGRHSLDVELYRAWLGELERTLSTPIAVQVTTESAGLFEPDAQMAAMRALRPEAITLSLAEIMPQAHDDRAAREFLLWLHEVGIAPQYILYTPEDVSRFHELRRSGVVPQARPFVIFVLGRYAAAHEISQPRDLLAYLERHDAECPWTLCAFGRSETAALLLAATLGGHLRVGFENNLHHADGTLAASNAERVEIISSLVRALGRPVMSGEQAGDMVRRSAA